jgi:hypothetical protein
LFPAIRIKAHTLCKRGPDTLSSLFLWLTNTEVCYALIYKSRRIQNLGILFISMSV